MISYLYRISSFNFIRYVEILNPGSRSLCFKHQKITFASSFASQHPGVCVILPLGAKRERERESSSMNYHNLKGQLVVLLTVYPWYLLCYLRILGVYNPYITTISNKIISDRVAGSSPMKKKHKPPLPWLSPGSFEPIVHIHNICSVYIYIMYILCI